MSFLAPLGFLFGLTIPVVILFYLLKRKRVVRLVSSTMLWQRFLAESQANAPFQKLRRNALLLLQIAILALAVLALARPMILGQARPARIRVLILDGSASMQSTDVAPSRFERARSEVLAWIQGMREDEQSMLLLAGAHTVVKQSPTSDQGALRRALEGCAPSDTPTRLADALKTAAAFTFEKKGEESVATGEIHLFSDGAAEDLDEAANLNLPLVYHRVGTSGHNLGLVALEVKAHAENPSERAIFASVANASTHVMASDLELRFEGELVEVRTLTLAPTNTQSLVFFAPQTRDGVFNLRLTARDDLAADNQASFYSPLPKPARVLLVTLGNRFLEKALRGLAEVTLSVRPNLLDDARGQDLVILDNVAPVVWPLIHTMAIRVADSNWFTGWSRVEAPPIVDWKSAHPLLRYVNFDNVQVAEADHIDTPAWGQSLVDSPETPLLVAGERDQRRVIWIGFDPLQSTWPLRVSFPIFVANAVNWLHPSEPSAGFHHIQAGSPWRLHLLDPIEAGVVISPDGRQHAIPLPEPTRHITFGETFSQGTYQFESGTNSVRFCVNLLDAEETHIQPRDTLPLGRYESVASSQTRQASLDLWRWLAWAALVTLLLEWWFYHKRTV